MNYMNFVMFERFFCPENMMKAIHRQMKKCDSEYIGEITAFQETVYRMKASVGEEQFVDVDAEICEAERIIGGGLILLFWQGSS